MEGKLDKSLVSSEGSESRNFRKRKGNVDHKRAFMCKYSHQGLNVNDGKWLRTHNSEDEATIVLGTQCENRNLRFTSLIVLESNFQKSYPKEYVLKMIKDGLYWPNFDKYVAMRSFHPEQSKDIHVTKEKIFEKVLRSSDVIAYRVGLPKISRNYFGVNTQFDSKANMVQVEHYDDEHKMWNFTYRYCGKQAGFTGSWHAFIKDNHLNEKDTIIIYRYLSKEHPEAQVTYMINIIYCGGPRRASGSATSVTRMMEQVQSQPVDEERPTRLNQIATNEVHCDRGINDVFQRNKRFFKLFEVQLG